MMKDTKKMTLCKLSGDDNNYKNFTLMYKCFITEKIKKSGISVNHNLKNKQHWRLIKWEEHTLFNYKYDMDPRYNLLPVTHALRK